MKDAQKSIGETIKMFSIDSILSQPRSGYALPLVPASISLGNSRHRTSLITRLPPVPVKTKQILQDRANHCKKFNNFFHKIRILSTTNSSLETW